MKPYYGEFTPIIDNGLIVAYVFKIEEDINGHQKHEEDNHESD